MTNLSLPFGQWPEIDRARWHDAVASGNVLDGQGPAAHWKEETRRTNIGHYGRWLGHLGKNGRLTRGQSPGDRAKPQEVRAYIEQLQATTQSVSVLSSVVGLLRTLEVMETEHDWHWLREISNKLRHHTRKSDRPGQHIDVHKVYKRLLKRLTQLAKVNLSDPRLCVEFRNALMLAMLCACPMRRKSFSNLTITHSVRKTDSGFRLCIPAEDTKTGIEQEFACPKSLAPHLEKYLSVVRPLLGNGYNNSILWLSSQGREMTGHSIYLRLVRYSEELFGVRITPHDLRAAAATFLYSTNSVGATIAPWLLGHTSSDTTEEFYVRANQISASRLFAKLITEPASE